MKRLALAIILLSLQAPLRADDEAGLAPAQADNSPQPDLTIDKWVPKGETPRAISKPVDTVPTPTSVESTKNVSSAVPPAPPAAIPPPASVPAPVTPRTLPRYGGVPMNEMTGSVASLDAGTHTIRVTVDGGVTPQFDYDEKTVIDDNGRLITMDDLHVGDQVVVRYIGKVLTAREIDRVSEAPATSSSK